MLLLLLAFPRPLLSSPPVSQSISCVYFPPYHNWHVISFICICLYMHHTTVHMLLTSPSPTRLPGYLLVYLLPKPDLHCTSGPFCTPIEPAVQAVK